ncbi:MAG: RDD family protein [Acidobacteria bacterium]|nr:RDD family protein [Acidobacteriota bacterium]MBI3426226.1 RDD family protein [Acidobacteriota bacterium]
MKNSYHQADYRTSTRADKPRRPSPKVVPLPNAGAVQLATYNPQSRPRLWQRLGAELINRLTPLLIVCPVFAFPLLLVRGDEYILLFCLLGVGAWHLFCDGSPRLPSPGKWLFRLRVVSVFGHTCPVWRKALRRGGTACTQMFYCLILALGLPSGIVEQQAHALAHKLLYPFALLSYQPGMAALLMVLALLHDAVSLLFVALSSDGSRFGDWLAGTRVITKAGAEELRKPPQR